jgi:hypothetical protein
LESFGFSMGFLHREQRAAQSREAAMSLKEISPMPEGFGDIERGEIVRGDAEVQAPSGF